MYIYMYVSMYTCVRVCLCLQDLPVPGRQLISSGIQVGSGQVDTCTTPRLYVSSLITGMMC